MNVTGNSMFSIVLMKSIEFQTTLESGPASLLNGAGSWPDLPTKFDSVEADKEYNEEYS